MLKISELSLGFSDAEDYKRRENKALFDRIFIQTRALKLMDQPNIFFLIGEKGTGKTAHAVYVSNSPRHDTINDITTYSRIAYIRETDYSKFLALKQEQKLILADYLDIWKVILYLLISQQIKDDETGLLSSITGKLKFRDLKKVIDEYYDSAFSPEVASAIDFVQEAHVTAKLLAKYAKVGASTSEKTARSETRFQTKLYFIQRQFENAFKTLKLANNYTLYIDGIDVRSSYIPYEEYLECIKGLANATWAINNDFFPNIKGSKGRMKVVLLMRPDIFSSIRLNNPHNKLRNNSVILDWRSTYSEYRASEIFLLVDRLLKFQQKDELSDGDAWDYYFPYREYNFRTKQEDDSSFIGVLRISMYRPRDILTILTILRDTCQARYGNDYPFFQSSDIRSHEFIRAYSDYLLEEIQGQLSFYHTGAEYELFRRFFLYLNGKRRFTYQEYLDAYKRFIDNVEKNIKEVPVFFETPDKFLQFLYELNIICYEGRSGDEYFASWSFRERNISNMSPQVVPGLVYSIHYGLSKALNVGRELDRF